MFRPWPILSVRPREEFEKRVPQGWAPWLVCVTTVRTVTVPCGRGVHSAKIHIHALDADKMVSDEEHFDLS
jgi:hypothetical protein